MHLVPLDIHPHVPTDPELPNMQNIPTVVTDEGEEVDHCRRVSDEQLFVMAHIDKTRPRPCDKKVFLYTLNQHAKPVKASMTYCHGTGNTSCQRSVTVLYELQCCTVTVLRCCT